MHNSGGQVLLLIILACVSVGIFGGTVSRARAAFRGAASTGRLRGTSSMPQPGRRGGGRAGRLPHWTVPAARGGLFTGFVAHRRDIRLLREKTRLAGVRDREKAHLAMLRDWARHAIRMREREAAAPPPAAAPGPEKNGGQDTPSPGTPADPPDSRERQVVPGSVVGEDSGPRESPPAASQPPPAATPPAGASAPRRAADPAPSPQSPSPSQPGGTPMSSGAVEQVVDGTHHIHARAAAGNIRAKQWAIKACAEVFVRLATMMLMLSRTAAESLYGPEITEPLAQAAVYAQAAAMACGQSDAAITSLANMRVGELADSPRQAPDRAELSETGAR